MNARDFIDTLNLEPHPEGGYFKETYRNQQTVQVAAGGRKRNLATSIYFLLAGDQKSHFHQLESDELWYYHAGCSTTIHIFEHGKYRTEVLGLDLSAGERPQLLLPAHSIFAAQPDNKNSFCLMGCMVNPGFDFKDFRMVDKEELLEEYPEYGDVIGQFTLQ